MAPLCTKRDPFHIHKILGISVLFHFVYRIVETIVMGEMFTEESASISSLLVGLHALLSFSSLLLHLPKKRNSIAPMIWPEFRLHSICFATRSVVATILSLYGYGHFSCLYGYGLDCGDPLTLALSRGCLVLVTVQVASCITKNYGSRDLRTTNAMPYPPHIGQDEQEPIKAYYREVQFGATACCFLPNATVNFITLLPIQTAPLLMTLVRKGKINALQYHRMYTLSLQAVQLVLWINLLRTGYQGDYTRCFLAFTWFLVPFQYLRTKVGLTATQVWCLGTLIAFLTVYPMYLVDKSYLDAYPMYLFENGESDTAPVYLPRSVGVKESLEQLYSRWAVWTTQSLQQHRTWVLTVSFVAMIMSVRANWQKTKVLFQPKANLT